MVSENVFDLHNMCAVCKNGKGDKSGGRVKGRTDTKIEALKFKKARFKNKNSF